MKYHIFISSRLFNEGFYLHSRITIQIFNTEAPVLLFNLLGWGESDTQSFSPRDTFSTSNISQISVLRQFLLDFNLTEQHPQ